MQLAMFDSNQNLPLPIIVAQKYDFPLQWHEVDGQKFFAIQDWVTGLLASDMATGNKSWRNMKNQTDFSKDTLKSLPYVASDGKTYQRDFADDETLYKIAQNLRVTAKRPQLQSILDYLAKAGAFADNLRLDPSIGMDIAQDAFIKQGKNQLWIDKRSVSVVKRKLFTAALQEAVHETLQGHHYGQATNEEYLGLFQRTKTQLIEQQGKSQNPRNHMHWTALHYISLAEGLIADELAHMSDIPFPMAIELIRRVCRFVGHQVEETQKLLGKDIATDTPLLD